MKQGKSVIAYCWIVYPNKVEQHWEEEVEVVEAEAQAKGPFAEVGFDASRTKNLGISVGAVKWGVSLKVPCEITEIEDVYEFTLNWVNGKMEAISKEIDG